MSLLPSIAAAAAPDQMAPDLHIDITAETCPMTFVRTRLALDRLGPGQILAVRLRGEEAARNIPRTSVEQGHAVLSEITEEDGTMMILLRHR